MLQLTTEQIAKALFKARHESRRKAKRYLKDHGGTGKSDELDAVIDCPTIEVQMIVSTMWHAREHTRLVTADNESKMHPRRYAAKTLRIVAAALDGDWEQVATLCDHGDASCWEEERREAILAWGTSSVEEIAAELDKLDSDGEFDDLLAINTDDADDLDYIVQEINGYVKTADRDVWEHTAEAALRAAAVKNGRYSVMPFYRKTLAPDGNCETLEFDDRDAARAWLLIAHDPAANRTSSYSVTLIDTMEDDE